MAGDSGAGAPRSSGVAGILFSLFFFVFKKVEEKKVELDYW